jgi:hypothetical protein
VGMELWTETVEQILDRIRDGRKGQVRELIEVLAGYGLFCAPCSARHHRAEDGGLWRHCLGVMRLALELKEVLDRDRVIPVESVIVASLFHDAGKLVSGFAGREPIPYYEENILKSGRRSEAEPFKRVRRMDVAALGVPVRSLMLVSRHVDLSDAEAQAILLHDGQYVPNNKPFANEEAPLTLLIHFADYWCSHVVEEGRPLDAGCIAAGSLGVMAF